MIEYELIRSNRKTLTIQVKPDGSVIVRAPVRLAKYRIAKFVKDHETWIFAQQEKLEKYRENMHVITDEERQEGILQAKKIFPERTAYFAERMGVTYNRITIREQKTRWGRNEPFTAFLGSCGKRTAGLPRTKGKIEKNGKTAGIKLGCFFAIHAKVMYNINIY